jgi:hypothetical protein
MLVSLLATLSWAGAVGVGLIFLFAGIMKLRHRALLPGVVANYRLLPDAAVLPVAVVLPFVEIGVGLALILVASPVAAGVAAAMLWSFAAAMAINIRRGRAHIDCGCGRSQLRQPLSRMLVGRNALLSLLVLPRLLPGLDHAAADPFTAAAGGLSLYVLYLLANNIGALVASPAIAPRR